MMENQNLPSGFQTSTSPMMSQVTDSVKGKGKAPDIGKRGPFNVQFDSGLLLASRPVGGAQMSPSQAAQDDVYGAMAQDDGFMVDFNVDANLPPQDVEIVDGTQDPQLPVPVDEEIEEVEPHRWITDVSFYHPLSPSYVTRNSCIESS